jgi:hypothetical protein
MCLDKLLTIVRIEGRLVFGSISNETLSVGEGDVGRSCSVSLIVGDDFDTIVLPDTDAGVGCSEIDTNCLGHFDCSWILM